MLPDYKSNLTYTPLKFRQQHDVVVCVDLAITTGAATLRTSDSSPQVTATGSGGTYTITLPKGQLLFPAAGFIERVATPVAADASQVAFGTLVATAGTLSVFVLAGNGAAPSFAAACTLRLVFTLCKM